MAEKVHGALIGDRTRLAFELNWPQPIPPDLAGLGWGDLVLWVGSHRHWVAGDRDPGPVRWTWLDLVEHLGRAWPFLRHEENAPFGLVAFGPEYLRDGRLLRSVRGRTETEVEDAVHAFQHRHDLAAGLKGLALPPLWLLREGPQMRVRCAGRDAWLPIAEVLDVLSRFVTAVLAHEPAASAPRQEAAVARWSQRETLPAERLWALRAGLEPQQLAAWTPAGVEPEQWWGDPAAEEETPFLAAARLSAPLPDETRRAVLDAVRAVGPRRTEDLDTLSRQALAVQSALAGTRPYAQGYATALWLRDLLGNPGDPVDPAELLARWGVAVSDLPPVDAGLDAVACWAPGRGPAVLLNPGGRHAHTSAGRQATLAHEVAHLLLDRGRRLPLVEVFGGTTPLHLEQRARAFAAELLLPRARAAAVLAAATSVDDARETLQRQFGVSREVVGWQIRNSPGWDGLSGHERARITSWCKPWTINVLRRGA